MTREELLKFLQSKRFVVLASASEGGQPEAAAMGVAVNQEFELVFDTIGTSRKVANLRKNPRIAFVIGWDDGKTAQYEGIAEELSGEDLQKYKPLYFEAFPDGPEREQWPNITYFVVRPSWIRYSDFSVRPPEITEFNF